MHGISPRNYSLTPQQQKTSAEISREIPELPVVLSELISEMAVPDFEMAMEKLELNKNGEAIPTQRTLQIIACIERALTAPSSECDPKIKATVFHNAGVESSDKNRMERYLIQIINGLKSKGRQIILDDIELDNVNFSMQGIDFSGISARRAVFASVSMKSLNLEAADFTDASFTECPMVWTNLNNVNFTNARFSMVYFHEAEAHGLIGNQLDVFKQVETRKQDSEQDGTAPVGNIIFLGGLVESAIADAETFTLPTKCSGQGRHPLFNCSRP